MSATDDDDSNIAPSKAPAARDDAHWSTLKEAGTLRGLRFLLWVYSVAGRKLYSLILYPVIVYFYVCRPVARRSSADYLATIYQTYPEYHGKTPGPLAIMRHLFSFGQSVLDKVLAWTVPMDENEFDIVDEPALRQFLDEDSGQLIIGSHLGNLEYCRGFVQRYKHKTINILVYDQHSANFVQMMQRVNPDSRLHVYQVDQLNIATILTLKQKIEHGEWLFIAGDRIPLSGEQRTVTVTFLQRPAALPIGPYMLAKVLQCPVKLMFSYRIGNKVRFDMVPFADRVTLSRKDSDSELSAYAQQFATELERQCRRSPMQWFNFYPYWLDSPGQPEAQQTRK